MTADTNVDAARLFDPVPFGKVTLRNRITMAPMTRMFSPHGIPGADVVEYYRRRAAGEVGLIITEGTYINHPAANGEPRIPAFYGEALEGWKRVVDAVHEEGGRIIPQIWHYGLMRRPGVEPDPSVPGYSAMAIYDDGIEVVRKMNQTDIDDVAAAYGQAAADAEQIGFDGVELHGAHEYLIDNFLWEKTNQRDDDYGGSIEKRSRFPVEVVRSVRSRISENFPLVLRYSQWKQSDYTARLAHSAEELERILRPISDAGVDVFDVSTRRFWEPAFDGSHLTLAAWTKRITGKAIMAVGSVGMDRAFRVEDEGEAAAPSYETLNLLSAAIIRGDFDYVGVGRALLSDPAWARKIRNEEFDAIKPYDRSAHTSLVI